MSKLYASCARVLSLQSTKLDKGLVLVSYTSVSGEILYNMASTEISCHRL